MTVTSIVPAAASYSTRMPHVNSLMRMPARCANVNAYVHVPIHVHWQWYICACACNRDSGSSVTVMYTV